jgi:hypothetical protein
MKDIKHNIVQDGDQLFATRQQEIPDSFLRELDAQKQMGGWTQSKDMMKLASIPVVVCDQMLREGLDVYKAPAKDIVRWLKQHDMERFLTH